MRTLLSIVLASLILISCDEEQLIPKPPTYLKLEIPDAKYENYMDSCNYTFDLNTLYTVNEAPLDSNELSNCHRRIDLGPLNGTIFFRYWDMVEPLAYYVNSANDEVERHQVKASKIKDRQIIRSNERVFGTVFELEGNVATPFQFYLTDSTSKFIYVEVLFNAIPNYDSLKPSLDYLEKDINQLLNTFKWNQ